MASRPASFYSATALSSACTAGADLPAPWVRLANTIAFTTTLSWANTRYTSGGHSRHSEILGARPGSGAVVRGDTHWSRSWALLGTGRLGLPWRSTGGGGKAPLGAAQAMSRPSLTGMPYTGWACIYCSSGGQQFRAVHRPARALLVAMASPPQRFRSAADSTVSVGLHSVTEYDLDTDFAGGLFYIVCGCPFYAVCKSRKWTPIRAGGGCCYAAFPALSLPRSTATRSAVLAGLSWSFMRRMT